MGKLKVRPQVENANAHNPYGLGLLETSIGRDGWIDAITVAADDESISGSARIETGAAKGWDFAHEEPLVIQAPKDRPIVVETDGSQPLINRRIDIPNADDPRARRLSVAVNQITAVDWTPDAGVLASWAADDDAIKGLFTEDSWSALLALQPTDQDWQGALGLPTGDRAPFQQMTFTVSDEQAEQIKGALEKAKGMAPFIETGNENSNGNALARVCEVFLGCS